MIGIVLNERTCAEQAIRERRLGKHPSETLRRVARYYIDTCNDIDKSELRERLENFLIQCDPTVSIPKWDDSVKYAVDWALKHEVVVLDSITITQPEMDMIDTVSGQQVKRLAFTLLCLAKYWDTANKSDKHWVNSKDSEIMSLANINTSVKRRCEMFTALRTSGMIQFSRKVDNTSVRVRFVEDGDPALQVTDLRNLGFQYLMWHGGDYFECANCGIVSKIDNPGKGRKQRYCKSCAIIIDTQKHVDAIMKRRNGDERSGKSRQK